MLYDTINSEFETKQSGSGLAIPPSGRLNIFTVDTTKVFGTVFIKYCIYEKDRSAIRSGIAEVTFSHTGHALMPHEARGPQDIGAFGNGDVNEVILDAFRTGPTLNVFFYNDHISDERFINYEVTSIRMPRDIAEKPMIQMTITGLGNGQTWKGLGNGTHFLSPQVHSIQRRSTAGSPYYNQENWSIPKPAGKPSLSSDLDGNFRMMAVQQSSGGHYRTYLWFYVYNTSTMIGAIAYGSPIFSGTDTNLYGSAGLLKDRALSYSGAVSGVTFTWQRMRAQRAGIWGNF